MDFDRLREFYNGKRVFVTGHTGFKGSWLCLILDGLGAEVYGYALDSDEQLSLFNILGLKDLVSHTIGDIRDYDRLYECYGLADPDIVFHLAAQPIVRDSYDRPKYTYETNVMGTVNILECMRMHPGAVSFLNVTTDKVYENNDILNYAFKEDDKLDGYDPYSNSKSCSELVTHSYKKSFFSNDNRPAISTARAGNVIGGGDFAKDRIIPDCVRAAIKDERIPVRNPDSIRPYQHVLEPLFAYLWIACEQAAHGDTAGYYNIGPSREDCITTGELVDIFVKQWGESASWVFTGEKNAPHEANFLSLDCSKARKVFGWNPVWDIKRAVEETARWYKAWNGREDMIQFSKNQILSYLSI